MNPRVIKESGYKHLDRVVELVRLVHVHTHYQCAKYGIYSIIDLHTAPGGKSTLYHRLIRQDRTKDGIATPASRIQLASRARLTCLPLVWDHKDFQDRAINLWEHFAKVWHGEGDAADS